MQMLQDENGVIYEALADGAKRYFVPGTRKIDRVVEPDGTTTYYRTDGKTPDYKENKQKNIRIDYYEDGKTVKYVKQQGVEKWYRNDKNHTKSKLQFDNITAWYDEAGKNVIREEKGNVITDFKYKNGYRIGKDTNGLQSVKLPNGHLFTKDSKGAVTYHRDNLTITRMNEFKLDENISGGFDTATGKVSHLTIGNKSATYAIFDKNGKIETIKYKGKVIPKENGKYVIKGTAEERKEIRDLIEKAKFCQNKFSAYYKDYKAEREKIKTDLNMDFRESNFYLENKSATKVGMKADEAMMRVSGDLALNDEKSEADQARMEERVDEREKDKDKTKSKSKADNNNQLSPAQVRDQGNSMG